MKFLEASVNGALLVEPKIIADDRGYFTRAFCAQEFRDAGVDLFVSQANLAGSRHRGTLRGMHYQVDPYEEGKLLRCIKGAVFDVVLDVREDSNTYGKWYGCVLTASNRNMLYVPPGCAHGYQTLEDDTEVYYLVSEYYNPGSERGIRWDDEQFCIDWPIKENPILSDKDRSWPDFRR
jgi:dTDP-4-dehydrorhamnose 3,5-epimerase